MGINILPFCPKCNSTEIKVIGSGKAKRTLVGFALGGLLGGLVGNRMKQKFECRNCRHSFE